MIMKHRKSYYQYSPNGSKFYYQFIFYSSYLRHFFYATLSGMALFCFAVLMWCQFKCRSTITGSDPRLVH